MMKKNITINLYGSLYQIDEDAYQLLQTYEDSMRAYFAKHEGGAEISDDIEHRIAELSRGDCAVFVLVEHFEGILVFFSTLWGNFVFSHFIITVFYYNLIIPYIEKYL